MGRRPTGVGRGNGEGSKKTQFQRGAPSANPHGRPRKEKVAPATSIDEALAREIAKTITTYENGFPRRMTQAEAMAKLYLSKFQSGSMNEQHQVLRYIAQHVPPPDPPAAQGLDEGGARKLVERLAEEAKKDRENDRRFPTPPR